MEAKAAMSLEKVQQQLPQRPAQDAALLAAITFVQLTFIPRQALRVSHRPGPDICKRFPPCSAEAAGGRSTRHPPAPHLPDQSHRVRAPRRRVHHRSRPEHASDFSRGSVGPNVIRPLWETPQDKHQFICFSDFLRNLVRAQKLHTV